MYTTRKDQPRGHTQDSRLHVLGMLRVEELGQKLAEEKPGKCGKQGMSGLSPSFSRGRTSVPGPDFILISQVGRQKQ